MPEAKIAERMKLLLDMDYSIHFHVWQPDTFLKLLSYCQEQLNFRFTIEQFLENHIEFICILKKTTQS
jgi:hypothetical protein